MALKVCSLFSKILLQYLVSNHFSERFRRINIYVLQAFFFQFPQRRLVITCIGATYACVDTQDSIQNIKGSIKNILFKYLLSEIIGIKPSRIYSLTQDIFPQSGNQKSSKHFVYISICHGENFEIIWYRTFRQ